MKRLILPALLLAGCAALPTNPTITPSPQALPNSSPAPLPTNAAFTPTAQPLELQSAAAAAERSRYLLDVSYNYGERRIRVAETLDYLNQSSTRLDELVFVVEAANLGREIAISRVAINGQETFEATLEGDQLHLPLSAPLEPGTRVQVSLDYELRLPNQEGPLGYSARQQNWADWYPFVPPYRTGEGWLLRAPADVGEHLSYESADFVVRLQIEEREDLLIAAAAPATMVEGAYEYSLEEARRFVWSASPDYILIEGDAEGVPVNAYVFEEHQAAGAAAVEAAEGALALFSELYGDYPYASLSIVEGDFPDGMESDGLFWLFNGYFEAYNETPQNYLVTLSAHETAHNWWFGQVGNDAALQPWLDEALCTYSEFLFYQRQYPDLIAWWWRFRVLDYSPKGLVNSSIYDHEGFAPYVQAVYFRGALFLDELREEMGEEAFLGFLADYAHAGRGRILSTDDFFSLLAQHTDIDLQPLWDEYVGGQP